MNDDRCERVIKVFPNTPEFDILGGISHYVCGKYKDPEKLYCEDCEREAFDD